MEKIKWIDHVGNDEVLQKAKEEGNVPNTSTKG